jgi:hypothetical protein
VPSPILAIPEPYHSRAVPFLCRALPEIAPAIARSAPIVPDVGMKSCSPNAESNYRESVSLRSHPGKFPQEDQHEVDGVLDSVGDNRDSKIAPSSQINEPQQHSRNTLLHNARQSLI